MRSSQGVAPEAVAGPPLPHLPLASRDEEDPLPLLGEREFTASLIKDTRGPVVEIGVGTCACLTLVLAAHGLHILTIDQDAAAVGGAQKILSGVGLLGQVAVVQAEAASLPLRSRSVRTVLAYDALHHAADLWAAVAGIAAVLHPCGRLIVSDWDEAANGFLGRLTQALRTHFRKVVVLPRKESRVYVCEHPRRVARRAGSWSRRKRSPRR